MPRPYKLSDEIKTFIVSRKESNPLISCRQLVPLVWERFQLKLSKSSVNAILKNRKLSSCRGRRRIRPMSIQPAAIVHAQENSVQPADKKEVIELISTRSEFEYVANCGCFLLRAADYKTAFTGFLTTRIASLLPEFDKGVIYFLLESLIYKNIFNNDNDLGMFLGKKTSPDAFSHATQLLSGIDISSLRHDLVKMGMDGAKINNVNDLCKECLQKLNSLVQELFFPTVYQFLDFPTMFSRFFCLTGSVGKKDGVLTIRFSYPPHFKWAYDIVWQDDFLNTTNRINQEKIITPDGEKLWVDITIGFPK